MKIVLAQLNPVVGDLAGNVGRLRAVMDGAAACRPDLVVFPELFLCGYPPRDLLARQWFVERVELALAEVAGLSARYTETGIVVGAVVRSCEASGKGLHNAAVLFSGGQELFRQAKSLLPTYDVFDEARYFDPAGSVRTIEFQGETLGLSICEDAWNAPGLWECPPYSRDPISELAKAGATVLVNISASPFTADKEDLRYRLMSGHARKHGLPMAFVNQVGGNDELVFDGASMAFDRLGRPQRLLPAFREAVELVETGSEGSPDEPRRRERIELVHDALVLGVRDYVRKCGFASAVIGLSGGIDSAVTACIAVAALGKENVLGVTMPSEFSSTGSVEDSRALAASLGIGLRVVPIGPVYSEYLRMLAPEFAGRKPDVTEENIQARIRGNILMAFSNKLGSLVLSTGNKSELAVGYCTLYGDMSGGMCVLSDVPKTMVYELAHYINREREMIPAATITKPPSAELRPNQTDQDTLPPYDVLDAIIERYVDDGQSAGEIVEAGFAAETVSWVIRTINRNEYKRRQAATGIKVTGKAFGIGWRMPLAARY